LEAAAAAAAVRPHQTLLVAAVVENMQKPQELSLLQIQESPL